MTILRSGKFRFRSTSLKLFLPVRYPLKSGPCKEDGWWYFNRYFFGWGKWIVVFFYIFSTMSSDISSSDISTSADSTVHKTLKEQERTRKQWHKEMSAASIYGIRAILLIWGEAPLIPQHERIRSLNTNLLITIAKTRLHPLTWCHVLSPRKERIGIIFSLHTLPWHFGQLPF